ncbi:hypothetical protein CHLNCDRAFT_141673 [Chlorella variabilis]|uniref:SET domain-containing protein n=1 Tax=Chlorella variabilis TaxID=554065 RepID=E1ZTC5_CHLVA|nr:hypothetical protein CHLNCDRAFT_141673 [Chlorella variabilis]EFN50876.1 hypothetical protein CHLNCDRAFT_141673 [Chlorella variabilis]|eukprot:XP_005842978.1 hypothetical protein CHLNCDRAFT_141673 [Chlorella variabilis]
MASLDGQIQHLLASPPALLQRERYAKLTAGMGLEVRLDAGGGKGKGVFATKGFGGGALLFREPPLAFMQHTANRPQAWVCARCFCFIGSVEQQVARLIMTVREGAESGSEDASASSSSDSGSGGGGGGHSMHREAAAALREEQLEGLAAGALKLPHTEAVPLPTPARCPGGCLEEWYCSDSCAEAAWQLYHQLLCVGPEEDDQQDESGSSSNPGKAPAAAAAETGETQQEERRRQLALREFLEHADETNDVFRLAANAVAQVLVAAQQQLGSQQQHRNGSGSGDGSSGSSSGGEPGRDACWQALLAGWQPFAAGHKGLWWECTAAPPEAAADMRQLAEDSLELLVAALPPHLPRRFPALLSLPIWGSIIGMFELNNLGVFVASPLQRWLHHLDALPAGEQAAAFQAAGPFVDALPDELPGCEGNAFYALHSCFNHSCDPNAEAFKRDEDEDGGAVILALRDIQAGEEVTLSYIDEEAPLEERRQQLADYGFRCACDKCQAEELAEALQLE